MSKTTYIVENDIGDVLEYSPRLWDAKNYLLKLTTLNPGSEFTILTVKGNYFGEGFHAHRYTYDAEKQKFKRSNLR
jgi:hypothetical protein